MDLEVNVERLAGLAAHGWMNSAFPFTYNPALLALPNGTIMRGGQRGKAAPLRHRLGCLQP